MMLSRVTLDRNIDVPLFRQLRAALEMRIIDGELRDGTPLPSIRRLATELDVAPITVVQAYKELQAQGYIQAVAKRGYFVTSGQFAQPSVESTNRLTALIDDLLDTARDIGVGEKQAAQLLLQRLHERQSRQRSVAVVGFRDASLMERVHHTQNCVSELKASVSGLSFEDLEKATAEDLEDKLASIDVFLVSVGEVRLASAILGKHAARILPMTRELRTDVVETIHGQPADSRFGIVANSPEYADRMVAELRRIRPASPSPHIAIVDDKDGVTSVFKRSDVVLIGSLARTRLNVPIPPNVMKIEFVFVPDANTLETLRDRLSHP